MTILEVEEAGVSGVPVAPRRAFVLDLKVQADTLEDLIGYLRSFETDLFMNKISTGVSGGYSAGSIYSLSHDPAITHESWEIALNEYLTAIRTKESSNDQ